MDFSITLIYFEKILKYNIISIIFLNNINEKFKRE